LNGSDQKEWKEAIVEEIECLINNDTWEIVQRSNKHPIIGCRMVLRNKRDAEGQIKRRKARLVARGFAQRPGIDYHDTFAPVARLESLRLLIALAAKHDLKIHQVDVTAAYLHGTIEEEIYMELPEQLEESLEEIVSRKGNKTAVGIKAKKMLEDLRDGNKTCRLKRALYGLKQAGRQWHKRLKEKLQILGLRPINADPCVFSSGQKGKTLFVLVYVDDILIFYQNKKDLNNICEGLLQDFNIKNLGEARYCLGIEITRRNNKITISQSGYIRELLSRFGMNDCNPVHTPIEIGAKLDKTVDDHSGIHGTRPYQELIGALNYLAVATRPDISHIVNCLSQFNTCHNERHWQAAKRVLRYLKGSIHFGITYSKDAGSLEGFVDADWAGCPVDRRSYTGYVFTLGGAAVSWESKKQRTIALSSTEAEYMALTETTKEAIYLRGFLSELKLSVPKRVQIMNDNRGALLLAQNHTFHARTKHVDVRHHFVRHALQEGLIDIEHLPSEEMPADFLTKGLPKEKHYRCMEQLGIGILLVGEDGASIQGEC